MKRSLALLLASLLLVFGLTACGREDTPKDQTDGSVSEDLKDAADDVETPLVTAWMMPATPLRTVPTASRMPLTATEFPTRAIPCWMASPMRRCCATERSMIRTET